MKNEAESAGIAAALRRAPLFDGMADDLLAAVAPLVERRTAAVDEVLVREHDHGDSLFLILDGQVRVVSDAASERVLLARLGPGECFGEMALLSGEPRTAAVIASTACTLGVLSRANFNNLAAREPALRGALEALVERRKRGGSEPSFLHEATSLVALSPALGKVSIGRSPENTIVIDEPTVSARHAELRFEGGRTRLLDLNSEGGTYVNRRPVIETDVGDGDEIWVGTVKLYIDQGVLKRFQATDGIRVEAIGIGRTIAGGRRILRDVDLAIYPGEMVAIVGPSGAGKTTLLHTLLGLTPPSDGNVYYDSYPLDENFDAFRRVLGYVPQDDIVHQDLTVEQCLGFAGRLRLPRDTTAEELQRRIDVVLKQLSLEGQRDVLVRNLSGGQRKRASIGIELLSEPRICFLDEPTSGLDPGLDEQMMGLLRRLANEGRTIILTTHATRNIEVCDRVVIVSGGLVVFTGTPGEALDHFQVDDFVEIYRILNERKPEQLSAEFRSSEAHGRNVTSRITTRAATAEGVSMPRAPAHRPRARLMNGLLQFYHLARRDLRVALADRVNMALRLLGPIVLGASLLVTFESQIFAFREEEGGNANAVITLLYLTSALSLFLGAFTAANAITRESAIFRRERIADLSPVAYVFAKVAVLTCFAVVQGFLLTGTLWLGIDFSDPQAKVTFLMMAALTLTGMAGMALGLLVSALSPNADRAAMLVVLVLIPQLIFAGATVPRSEMREPARYVSDGTMTKWSLELLGGINSLDPRLFQQSFKFVIVPGFETSSEVLVEVPYRPFEFAFRGDTKVRWAVLAGFFTSFVAATTVVQSRKGRAHHARRARP